MRTIFPVGNFVDPEPRLVQVQYDLPYNKAIDFLAAQDAHVHDMRDSYVIDRGKVREKTTATIPIWVFKTTFPAVSRFQFNHICFEVGKRPITFIELLAFARNHSMMDEFTPGEQTVTNALGSLFDTEDEGKRLKASVSLMEIPDHMRSIGPRRSIGFAEIEMGFGEGVFLPVTDRD